jgi:beta-N-acetylhexosaminidase
MDPVFREQAGVMIGHLAVPGLSDELPTSLSPETIGGLLRDELGFGGLVFTDAMNMGAIINTYGLLDALEQAIVAGADIAILGSLADVTPALDHLVMRAQEDQNFATVIDNRAARVLAAKGQGGLCTGAQ